MKPGARGSGHPKRNSYNTLIVIVCFSVGLLGGYLILGTPRAAHYSDVRRSTVITQHSSGQIGRKTWPTKRELITTSAHSTANVQASLDLPRNEVLGRKPPAKDEVPKEMAAAIKQQQSDKSERGTNAAKTGVSSEMAAALKKQQSDKSESAVTAKTDDKKAKETLMKAQQSETSERNTTALSARQEQAKSALAGGTSVTDKTSATTTATAAASTNTSANTTTGGGATAATVSSPSPSVAKSYPGVFPDANTWPITPVKEKMQGNTIHTLFTSNGSPYQNIQARIMVGTYNIVRKMPGGERLVALTRILHRTTPDEVMDEIPTFIAQPLQPECDKWCWFPVADRANAFQQWLNAAEKDPSLIKAPWLLLLETDYVWVKPLPDPGDAYDRSVPGWSFGFDYIAPKMPLITQLLKERCPDCEPNSVPNSGPAPVLARFSDFKAATPIWEELSKWIETHEDAKKMLGWVREMYAWDIGVAANKLNIRNQGPPASPLIAQPPHDLQLGNASMYHYTWGTIYKKPGVEKEIWMFDKRTYTAFEHQLKLPLIPMPPAWTNDITLQDGLHVTEKLHNTVVDMLTHMNEAIKQLPDLTQAVAAAAANRTAAV